VAEKDFGWGEDPLCRIDHFEGLFGNRWLDGSLLYFRPHLSTFYTLLLWKKTVFVMNLKTPSALTTALFRDQPVFATVVPPRIRRDEDRFHDLR
jgi:hypothetical protein